MIANLSIRLVLAGLLAIFQSFPTRAQTIDDHCNGEPVECRVELGVYNIALPDEVNPKSAIPAMIFFHGAGGSGPKVMKNSGMVEAFTKRGYAVIEPSGLKRPNSHFGPGWSFLPFADKQRDELAFAKQVLADASSRFNIDRNQVLMSGFSIGGSLVWYMACEDNSVARAYAPVAGAFWQDLPQASDCTGPVRLLHTHG